MSSYTTYDALEPFFGGVAKQSRLYVTLNYTGSDFTNGPNTKENPDVILGMPIWQLMNARNYKSFAEKEGTKGKHVLSNDFITFIENVAYHHKNLDKIGGMDVASTANAQELGKQVYRNWASLSQDARDFYEQNVNFVVGGKSGDRAPTRSTPASMEELEKDVRLNLKKHDAVKSGETVFGHCIPYLPKGTVSEDGSDIKVDFLHDLYNSGVRTMSGGYQRGGNLPGIDAWTNLDVDKFITEVLAAKPVITSRDLSVKGELDGVYYDLALDGVYARDPSDGLVKLKKSDGSYQSVSDMKKGVPASIFSCILAGDSVGLATCLSAVSSQDIGNEAEKEVNQMNPNVIKKLLATFSIRTDGNGVVEEYLEWRSNLESRLSSKMGSDKGKRTAGAILANKKLCRYLQAVMELQRRNPILHERNVGNLSDLPDKNIQKSSNLAYFRQPTHIDRAQALSRSLGVMVQNLNVLPQNILSLFRMNQSNLMYRNPLVGIFGAQMGGGNQIDETVKILRSIYTDILEDMRKQGKDLVQEDKDRIEKALNQIEVNNKQVASKLNDLRAFVNLDNSLKVGLSTVSLRDIEGSSRIKNLRKSVANLEDCVNRTSREQVSLLTALIEQVYRPMLLVSSGVSTPLMRAVGSS